MNVLIVYCHPEPESFNGSLKDVAIKTFEASGHTVTVSDLYGEGFDPVEKAGHYKNRVNRKKFDALSEQRNAYQTKSLPIDVKREIKRLESCDLLILQFPLWWHQQPAMLKGWFDRVFVAGGLYTSRMRYDRGYFKGKRAICSVTSGAPESTFTSNGRGGGEIETLLHSINYSLHYMGFSVLPPYLTAEVQGAGFTYKSPEQFEKDIQAYLERWKNHFKQIDQIMPMSYPGWRDWDENIDNA